MAEEDEKGNKDEIKDEDLKDLIDSLVEDDKEDLKDASDKKNRGSYLATSSLNASCSSYSKHCFIL